MGIQESIENYTGLVGNNIRRIMEEKGFSQLELVKRTRELGCPVSQGTVSTATNGKGNISLANLVKIASALEVELSELFRAQDCEVRLPEIHRSHTGLIITSPDSSAFKGYLGKFYVYFYKTAGREMELVTGEMNVGQSSKNLENCPLTLTLSTGDTAEQDIPIQKQYTGEMVVSTSMHSAYCFLYGEEIGEICLLVFHHWYLLHNDLKCAMASAVTTSSGSNRRPTVHRVCLSRNPVDDSTLPFLKGQLLMNDANIILSQSTVNRLLNRQDIPAPFRELLEKSVVREKYCILKESSLTDEEMTNYDQARWISYLRSLSVAPKYNKISMRTDEILFQLLYPQRQE